MLPGQLANRDLGLEQVRPEQNYLGISADFVQALLSMQAVLALVPVTRFGEHSPNLRAMLCHQHWPLYALDQLVRQFLTCSHSNISQKEGRQANHNCLLFSLCYFSFVWVFSLFCFGFFFLEIS